MARQELQMTRMELKFLIPEETALKVREFIRGQLELDEFCMGKPNLSYGIHSLYLDSENLDLYWHTINGNKNRYKLRIRFYDDRPATPAFFEIKRRVDNAILKSRAAVRRSAVESLVTGQLPEPSHLLSDNPSELVALQNFSRLMLGIGAKPAGQVNYVREAWVSPNDNSVRVTMDRAVQTVPRFHAKLATQVESTPFVFGKLVILELKYTGRFPNWFRDLVQTYHCMQCGAAKYAGGIDLLGREYFYPMRHHHYVQPIFHPDMRVSSLRRQ
jgi:hypothetical protein